MTRRSVEVPGLHHGGLPIPVACVVGNLLASSGISPLDPATGGIPDAVPAARHTLRIDLAGSMQIQLEILAVLGEG